MDTDHVSEKRRGDHNDDAKEHRSDTEVLRQRDNLAYLLRFHLNAYDVATPDERESLREHVKSSGKTPYQLNGQTRFVAELMTIAGTEMEAWCESCGRTAFGGRCAKTDLYHMTEFTIEDARATFNAAVDVSRGHIDPGKMRAAKQFCAHFRVPCSDCSANVCVMASVCPQTGKLHF